MNQYYCMITTALMFLHRWDDIDRTDDDHYLAPITLAISELYNSETSQGFVAIQFSSQFIYTIISSVMKHQDCCNHSQVPSFETLWLETWTANCVKEKYCCPLDLFLLLTKWLGDWIAWSSWSVGSSLMGFSERWEIGQPSVIVIVCMWLFVCS